MTSKFARIAAPAFGVLLVAALIGPASPAAAAPIPDCAEITTCTEQFDFTGALELWTVPDGVSEVTLTVAAGSGGDWLGDGGAGGTVTGTVPVDSGNQLALAVGGQGAGAFGGGGGPGIGGAAGGGGSFVFLESTGAWAPLLIAGGGGGGGSIDTVAPGGDGGFSDISPDAAPAGDGHSAGGTTEGAGYGGGNVATFDGTTFTPGNGQDSNSDSGGGGGGGYYGGAYGGGGGGGSGYAASNISVLSGTPNIGAGFIKVSYANPRLTEATLTVQPGSPVAGEPMTLSGSIAQIDAAGDTGTLTFSALLGADQVFTQAVIVTTSGSGPFTAAADVEFVPEEAGTYIFKLTYSGATSHSDATAADVTSVVSAAAVVPANDPGEELADTGAGAMTATALGALGAGLLGAGAILYLIRRQRARHS